MTKKTDDLKTDYLDTMRDLVASLHRRNALTMCPYVTPTPEELRELSLTETAIERACASMRKTEVEVEDSFGVRALLGQDAGDGIRSAVALLAANVVTRDVSFRSVSELAELACGRVPADLVALHDAFTRTGVLRPHVRLRFRASDAHVGEARVSMRESSYRVLLGLSADSEMDEMERATRAIARD